MQVEFVFTFRMFLQTYVVLSVLTVLSVADECKTIDSCTCKTSSRTISLKALSSTSGTPRFSVNSGNTIYYYNPCKEFTKEKATADVIQLQNNVYYPIGNDVSAQFSGDPDLGTLTLTYNHTDTTPVQTRYSYFELKCDHEKDALEFIIEKPTIHYYFTLKTDLVCSPNSGHAGGLSTGSVLVILFFVFLAIYLIAGILFLKFVRKAEGLELVPNFDFWKALPSLIRDGCYFTFRGCKAEATYEKI